MKLFGLLIPTYRKGTSVIITDPTSARGASAEDLFRYLDPENKYKRSLYISPKRGVKGHIVTLIKYTDSFGISNIYYGVLIKDQLYAMEESKLVRA